MSGQLNHRIKLMSYQVLARKWRPGSFDDMVGQQHVLKALINALDTERVHHAYLFTGTRGVGKTTLARILAKCLNCEQGVSSKPCGQCSACVGIDEGRFIDLIEVDAASRAKVDETRELMENVQYSPTAGRYKVYLIDEVHMFSNHSFNALLKTLEEPPPHVKFLLATTEPKKLPVTILSRCLQFNLKHLTADQIAGQLETIIQQEKLEADDGSVRLIAAAADGSMRDALSLLDQAIAYCNTELQEARLREMLGAVDKTDLSGLINALLDGDAQALFEQINKISEFNTDYDAVLTELLSCLHNIAVAQVLPEQSDMIDETSRCLMNKISKEDVQLYYQIGLNGRRDLSMCPDPRSGFEMTLIRMLAFRPAAIINGKATQTKPLASMPQETAKPVDKMASISQQAEHSTASSRPAEKQSRINPGNGNWKKIIDEMALAGLVKELAGHCVLKEHTDNKVHLVLMPSQEHLLKTTQKDRLQEAIRTRFGQHVKLIISVDTPGEETPAQQRIREAKEKHENAVNAFQEDVNVKSIEETFGATLREDSIQSQ